MRIERTSLAMDDGVPIALTLHRPDTGEGPWPVVFEARPYRKDDVSDATPTYRRLVDEGDLVVCRADVRGTGSSGGIAEDEYTDREWTDHLATIAWLAAAPWSNGNVGMYGTSYSGFNALQIAALQPPALKAIIPIYATDRRYTDDVHFGGGVRRFLDALDYPTNMVAMNALPPAPGVWGDGWREEWLRRIAANEPWMLRWLEAQDEPGYWDRGSIWFDGYERIRAATLIIAGHADGYRNMALRGYERLRAPKAVLFGPWSHMSPRNSLPGPRIDHVPVMLRWWRRWLADDETGVDREAPIRVFVRRPSAPRADLTDFEGEWRAEPDWPSPSSSTVTLPLRAAASPHGTRLDVLGEVGPAGSIWCAADLPFGLPWDQRRDEAGSLVFEWLVEDAVTILGHPVARLRVRSSAAVAFVSAKLCVVHEDGASELITRGIGNLTHRDGHDRVRPVAPEEPVDIALELDVTAFALPARSRLRLDVAGSDVASSWPPPGASTLEIDPAASSLELPTVGPPTVAPPVFAPGDPAPHRPDTVSWTVADDVVRGERRVRIAHGGVRGQSASGVDITDTYGGEVGLRVGDPGIAWARGATTFEVAWPEATVRTASRLELRSDPGTWRLTIDLEVFEGDERIAARHWQKTVDRHLQ